MKDLERMCSTMEEITSISNKKNGRSYTENAVYKKIEEGILDKIPTASDDQLKNLLNTYKFVFYNEYNDKKVLAMEIQKRIREYKLVNLLNDEK